MTTYTTITNAEVDQDSPVTQPLMTALRDNPLAIAEGDATAPGIQIAALKMASGSVLRISNDPEQVVSAASTVTVFEMRFFQQGAFNLYFSYRHVYGQTATVRVYVNEVLINTYTTTSTTYVGVSADYNMTIYGTIRVAMTIGSGASQEGRISNIRISTNGEHVLPFFLPAGYTYTP